MPITSRPCYLDGSPVRIESAFPQVAHWLDTEWRTVLHERMRHVVSLLRA